MYKDLEPELVLHIEEGKEEPVFENMELNDVAPIEDRFNSWLKIIDN